MTNHIAHLIRLSVFGLFSIFLLAPTISQAQCGSTVTSMFPNHIAVCPRGDIVTSVTILDPGGLPCVGSVITMSINQNCVCGALTATAITGNNGVATFRPRSGGCCSGPGVVTWTDASGVVLGSAALVNSPDMSGDCAVNLTDVTMFATQFVSAGGRCADFNGDGAINLVDVVIISNHIGH